MEHCGVVSMMDQKPHCPVSDMTALIGANPLLYEVRANQVTRIMAQPLAASWRSTPSWWARRQVARSANDVCADILQSG